MKEIILTGKRGYGKVALVDDEDYEMVNQYKWFVKDSGKKQKCLYAYSANVLGSPQMHRFILKSKDRKKIIDHINQNGLDNRRCNLRECTYSQNNANKLKKIGKKYLGTIFYKSTGKYAAAVSKNGISYRKMYNTEKEAAIGYNELAKIHHGEFARLNIIEDSE